MPLITRNSQNANVKLGTTAQLATITFTDGDLASDTTTNKVKVFNGTTLSEIGTTSFSSSAVVSQSTTIGDYTTPTTAVISSPTSGTVEFLVVAGGGNGGNYDNAWGGGGGAGGYLAGTETVTAQTYPITVGLGAVGGFTAVKSNGGNSSFSTYTSIGGGAGGNGGGSQPTAGSNGGSGGGSGNTTVATGTAGQGNNGGTATGGGNSGGGGGAGGVGQNQSAGGAGGIGVSNSISGSAYTYCTGAVGDGNASGVNYGDGGSGQDSNQRNRGSGSNGIVILRYLTGSITATGGTTTTSGAYTIHSFTSSGNFVVSFNLSSFLIDNDVTTKWTSSAQSNPNGYVDMGSALNLCAAAFYFDSTNTTNTEILIQSSPDASVWTTKRTITTSNLSNGAYNYYRFNIAGGARYIRFYGNSAGSTVLSIWEIKIMKKTDAEIFNDLGMLTITASDTSLGPDGA